MRTCVTCGTEFQTYDDIDMCETCVNAALHRLKARGVSLLVSGCGCCDGNQVEIFVDGQHVISANTDFLVISEDLKNDEKYYHPSSIPAAVEQRRSNK